MLFTKTPYAIIISFLISILCITTHASDRAVAMLYDDSGSMAGAKWIAANKSAQILSALLSEDDELYFAKMNGKVENIAIPSGVDNFLTDMRKESLNGTTPYKQMPKLIEKLVHSNKKQKWLITVTDGSFESLVQQQVSEDLAQIIAAGITPVFVYIEDTNDTVAKFWGSQTNVIEFEVSHSRDLPKQMQKLAALITGRDNNGLSVDYDDNNVIVSSKFPIKSLVTLYQGNDQQQITSARSNKSGKLTLRQHIATRIKPHNTITQFANIAHITTPQGVIGSGDNLVQLSFSDNIRRKQLVVYPEVDARFETHVFDMNNQPLTPNKQGIIEVCYGDQVLLKSGLITSNNTFLSTNRNDIGSFAVGYHTGSKDVKATMDAKQEWFEYRPTVTQDITLTPFAKYVGYFDFQNTAVNIKTIDCKRDVQITNQSVLNNDGVYLIDITHINNAPPLKFAVTVNGKPAPKKELQHWKWHGIDTQKWQLSTHDGYILLKPYTSCCLSVWSRATPHQAKITFSNITTNHKRDVIKAPNPMFYKWTLPANPVKKYWWLYGCPIIGLFGMIFGLWYFYRILFVKKRFSRTARIYIRDATVSSKKLVKGFSGLLMHWFWPAKHAKKMINGITFIADGSDGFTVTISGKSLTKNHEVKNFPIWKPNPINIKENIPFDNVQITQDSILVKKRDNRKFEYQMIYAQKSTSELKWIKKRR